MMVRAIAGLLGVVGARGGLYGWDNAGGVAAIVGFA